MPIVNRVADLHTEITDWRQQLHQHPELGYEEVWTSDFVAKQLEACGIEIHRGMGKTGVVGVLKGNKPGTGSIALRADFDALPITELNDLDYKSQNPGNMHACGHDGHTAMLLGAAKYLSETKNFAGTVFFVFQPAEEGGGGGLKMIEDGLFDKFPADAVYGMHNMPGIPLGEFAMRSGPIMASADEFGIKITGSGGHAAMPHTCVDPVVVCAQIILALQSIVSRETDTMESVVLSCTVVKSEGEAFNVIPDVVQLTGTVRALDETVRHNTFKRIEEVAKGVCSAMRATCEVDVRLGYPVTVNHEKHVDIAAAIATEIVGADMVDTKVNPMMGAEDFSYMLQEKPGCYIFVGNGAEGEVGSNNLHAANYNFNDEASLYGTSYWIKLVEGVLA
ncbi:MAG: M20 aminoacylase family protein [Alphaproteobacteria bacterium]